jgi:spermidine synthase
MAFSALIVALLVIGAGGIVAQTILLREFLIVFSGNELSIGVIIGAWIIWEALGAVAGGLWRGRDHGHGRTLAAPLAFFTLFFLLSIYLIRDLKVLTGIPPETDLGILAILWSSLVILAPTGFFHGFLFTRGCAVYNTVTNQPFTAVGKVYFFEMLGTIAGGLLVSFILIPCFNSFQTALVVAALNALACAGLTFPPWGHQARAGLAGSLLLFGLSVALLFGGAQWVQEASLRRQWEGKKVVGYANSPYQNITVVKDAGQYTFFCNGVPAIVTPLPDIIFTEEFVHFPLLLHPSPRRILVLGGGAGGVMSEILKYPTVQLIDYVEIDPLLLRTIQEYPTALTEAELKHPAVRLHYQDARLYARDARQHYDVVLLGFGAPQTLQGNRFFTKEFFRALQRILRKDGLIAFHLPGSLTYYSHELKVLNSCILNTVRSVLPSLFIIPGDTNLVIAGAGTIPALSPRVLHERLESRGIATRLLTAPHFAFRLEEQWQRWFSSQVADPRTPVNTDVSPRGLFYSLAYRNMLLNPTLKPFFRYVQQISLPKLLMGVLTLFLLFSVPSRRSARIPASFAIATTGFAALVLELILLFSFQVSYGYVFYEIGLLITLFMAGAAGGGIVSTTLLDRWPASTLKALKVTDCLLASFCFLTAFFCYHLHIDAFRGPFTVHAVFFFLLACAGFLTGMEFPLANHVYREQRLAGSGGSSRSVESTAGVLYGLDLFGAWIGGIAGGLVILPVLGLVDGCLILGALKASSTILLCVPTLGKRTGP